MAMSISHFSCLYTTSFPFTSSYRIWVFIFQEASAVNDDRARCETGFPEYWFCFPQSLAACGPHSSKAVIQAAWWSYDFNKTKKGKQNKTTPSLSFLKLKEKLRDGTASNGDRPQLGDDGRRPPRQSQIVSTCWPLPRGSPQVLVLVLTEARDGLRGRKETIQVRAGPWKFPPCTHSPDQALLEQHLSRYWGHSWTKTQEEALPYVVHIP